MGRLVVLQASTRLPSGLLSRTAWHTLDDADVVAAAGLGTPLSAALSAQGVTVDVVPDVSVARLTDLATDRAVVWLLDPVAESDLLRGLADLAVRRGESGGEGPAIEVLVGSFDPVGARLLDLVEVMDRLRQECPWDQQQTHESLVQYLVEETYETVEAIESADVDHLREELGDLLLQVVFHARIAAEDVDLPFTIDDVAGGIVDKLVRRHPHVFADTEVSGAGEVESNWESIKAAEKSRESAMDGIPLGLPALSLAHKMVGRARRAGLALPTRPDDVPVEHLANALLALVVTAEAAGVDPEQLLRQRVRDEMDAVRAREQRALADEAHERR